MMIETKRSKRIGRAVWLMVVSTLLTPVAQAQWEFATDISLESSGVFITPRDVVTDSGSGPLAPSPVANLPDTAGLMGYHPEGGGDYLYASRISVELPGPVLAERRDVVRVSGGAESIAFDGDAEGIPIGIGIDAVSQTGTNELLLSFDTSLEQSGLFVGHTDLVQFDGGVFSLFFDASAEGIPEALGLDAAHYEAAANRLVLSFATSGAIDGIPFDDEDLMAFDRTLGSWTLALDASTRAAELAAADLVAVPEPAMSISLLAGSALLLGARRRPSPARKRTLCS